jgi:hypothetical protein
VDWELPDPGSKPLEEVRTIRDEIDARVRALVEELVAGSVATVLRRVDIVELEATVVEEYRRIVEGEMASIMEDAGAAFEGCWQTVEGLGEPVWVHTVWSCPGFEAWNVIRRDLVLDPRWYACADRLHDLTRSGTRRFYQSPTDTPAA